MNQTEFLSKSHKSAKSKKLNPLMFILIGMAILAIIFIISFSVSYKKIATGRSLDKDEESVVQNKSEEIIKLEKELAEKDRMIEELKLQIKDYEQLVIDLQEREEYAKMIAEEMQKLPKDKIHIVYVPADADTDAESLETSEVQQDLYEKQE